MSDFTQYLAKAAVQTEQALERLLPQAGGQPEQRLYEAMRYSLFAGGKRLRPAMFFAVLDACGYEHESYADFAAALEMIHTYSLIHDDLPAMDDDDLRRGRPTCHRAFDEATAILAGDGLLTQAFAAMTRPLPQVEPVAQLQAVALVARQAGLGGMVTGQAAELALAGHPLESAQLEYIYLNKTGALFVAAAGAAALLAGATSEQQAAVELFAQRLGVAFQIIDDVLDKEGDAALLGKPTGSDEKNQLTTFVTLYGAAAARRAAEAAADEAVAALACFDARADILRAFAAAFVHRGC